MKDLTTGPVFRLLLTLSGQFMLNMIAATALNLANVYWVGKLGAKAQAAVTLAWNPMMLMLALAYVVSVGTRVLMAHAVGARDRERASRIFNEALGASLLLMVALGGLAWACRDAFGAILTSDAETAALISAYFYWFIPGTALQMLLSVQGAALGGSGDMRASTVSQVGAMLLNLVSTPVLIFGWLGCPRLGIDGAGIATLISNAVVVLGLTAYFARRESYLKMRPVLWLARPQILWRMLRIGLPTGIESAVGGILALVFSMLLRPFGPAEQAAFGVGQRLIQAGLIPLMALMGATSVLAGQNFGARLSGRVRETFRASLVCALIVSPALVVMFEAVPHGLCGLFSDDPAVIEGGSSLLRIGALSFIPTGVALAALSVLAGLGNTAAGLIATTAQIVLVTLAGVFLASFPGFNPDWLWGTLVAGNIAEMLMALFIIRREFAQRLTGLQPIDAMALGAAGPALQ